MRDASAELNRRAAARNLPTSRAVPRLPLPEPGPGKSALTLPSAWVRQQKRRRERLLRRQPAQARPALRELLRISPRLRQGPRYDPPLLFPLPLVSREKVPPPPELAQLLPSPSLRTALLLSSRPLPEQ